MPGARVVAFGHMGDGNIHFNVSQPVGADKAAFLDRWEAMNEVVHAIVARHSGSFSAEHGIGALKRELLKRAKDPVALDLMRAIKGALDPAGLMNPGKVLCRPRRARIPAIRSPGGRHARQSPRARTTVGCRRRGACALCRRRSPLPRRAPRRACAPSDFDGAGYMVCAFDVRRDDIRLYLERRRAASPTPISPRSRRP